LAGEILLREDAILFDDHHRVDEEMYDDTGTEVIYSLPKVAMRVYSNFLKLSVEDQNKVLELYGPMDGYRAADYRLLIQPIVKHTKWSIAETDLFVKLSMIIMYTSFGGTDSKTKLFHTFARFTHSCQPNCRLRFEGIHGVCQSLTNINEGDELTVTYNNEMDSEPTYARRAYYQISKDFLCDCPRCTALGDDTRQFNCSDKKCPGRHYACQPTSDAVPYLLPCVVCNLSASKEFERLMFKWEVDIAHLYPQFITKQNELARLFLLKEYTVAQRAAMFEQLLSTTLYPEYHVKAMRLGVKIFIFWMRNVQSPAKTCEYVHKFMCLFENMCMFPNHEYSEACFEASKALLYVATPDALQSALFYGRKAVRVQLLVVGRHTRSAVDFDDGLMNVLKVLPPQEMVIDKCSFCYESPELVAINLSKCAACKRVAYCTRECQKAHWRCVHKAECKK
jgi:hypothetical protein